MAPSSCVPVLSSMPTTLNWMFLRHEDHVTYLTLFEFGCLITHDSLVGIFIGKRSPLLEFEKVFISAKLLV